VTPVASPAALRIDIQYLAVIKGYYEFKGRLSALTLGYALIHSPLDEYNSSFTVS